MNVMNMDGEYKENYDNYENHTDDGHDDDVDHIEVMIRGWRVGFFNFGSGTDRVLEKIFRVGSGMDWVYTDICIIYRANRVLSGIEKLDRVFFGYFFQVTYFLYGMFGKRL